MHNLIERNRRSEKMTKEERRALRNYILAFPTKFDAALALGVSRPTLDNLIFKGSGKPRTIKLIREKVVESEVRA